MESTWIDDIGKAANAETEQAFSSQVTGLFWRSNGYNPQSVRYDAHLVRGIHVGCGITRGISSRGPIGEVSGNGADAMAIICVEPVVMTTLVRSGAFQSCGLSVPSETLGNHAWLAAHSAAFGSACIPMPGVPKSVIAALSAPVDPWFQGATRDLVYEARSIELLALLRQSLEARPLPIVDRSAQRVALAMNARAVLDAETATPPSISELARRLSCSPRTLTAAFRLTVGVTIGAYLTRRRLHLGAAMLRDGVGPTEAAYRVGYTPAHFSTVFKRHYGHSPSDWRSH